MKKYLFLLLLIQISCVAFSQTSFRVRLDSAYFSQATSIFSDRIARCVDGGYCIAGPTWDINNGIDVMLIKTDSNGVVEWSKTYGYTFNYIAEINLVASPDSGFYLSINDTDNGPTWFGVFYLMKIDKAGNVLLSKESSGPAGFNRYQISLLSKEKNTNNLNMLWEYANLDVDGSIMGFTNFFCKMDSAFNIIFSTDIDLPFWEYSIYHDISNNGITGGYLIGGIALIKLDALGNLVWKKYYTGDNNNRIVNIEQVDSNFYLLEVGIKNLALRKIDFWGNTIFYKIIDSTYYFTQPVQISATNIMQIDSTHLLISGVYSYPLIPIMIETDLNGSVVNAMRGTDNAYTWSAIDRNSKSLLFSKRDTLPYSIDSHIMFEREYINNQSCNYTPISITSFNSTSTDSTVLPNLNSVYPILYPDMTVGFSYTNIVSTPICSSSVFTNANYYHKAIEELELYPSPTTATVTIHTTKQFKNAQILIFNNLGEKIFSSTFDGTKTINCKTFAKGIYFVRIADGERQVTKKLVVE